MEIYLVGGAVRDELMGRPRGDRDFVVLHATAEEFAAVHEGARIVGRKGVTFIWRGEEYTLSEAPDIEADLACRDLTVNALARDSGGRLHALPSALSDLERRALRPVSRENFLADPLRVLRAARFAACLPDFSSTPELVSAMRAAAPLLGEPAAERAGVELRKACACPAPHRFFDLLAEAGCLAPWFVEFEESPRAHDAARAAEAVAHEASGDPLTVWMAMCHVLAPAQAEALGERLMLPIVWRKAARAASEELPLLMRYAELSPREKAELLPRLHVLELFDQAVAVAQTLVLGFEAGRARADKAAVLAVRLPARERGRGAASGELLRLLRESALERSG